MTNFDDGVCQSLDPAIRKLWEFDQTAISQHFLRLDASTRRSRFGGAVGEEFVEDYAKRLLQIGAVAFGSFPDQELRGVAELRWLLDALPKSAEAAFSVETAWQDQGIGNALMTRIIAAAQNRGIRTLHLICLPENEKMQHLAAKQSAVLTFDSLQIEATLEPPWPTPLSIAEEIAGEAKGFVTAVLRW